MAVFFRYEMDTLKEVCESSLQTLVDQETVIALLGIADHYNASSLKVRLILMKA